MSLGLGDRPLMLQVGLSLWGGGLRVGTWVESAGPAVDTKSSCGHRAPHSLGRIRSAQPRACCFVVSVQGVPSPGCVTRSVNIAPRMPGDSTWLLQSRD